MPKDKNISRKTAFYKARRKRGLTNEQIRPLWEARVAEEAAKAK